ncbi:MAG: hypothetical protein K6G44_06325 [Lentisphaeria bacterium]|nr:hypothetical protein [Lentisphaeria bacterium]
MPSIPLIDITRPDAEFPPEDAIPVLNLPDRQDRDVWLPRLIRAKRPFAISSLEAISQEEVTRLAETCRRRKLPVVILNTYRLIPAFARLREVAVSGCLGVIDAVQIHVPTTASAVLCADLALWLLPNASSDALSTTDGHRIAVIVSGPNGKAEASLDMDSHDASLVICIGYMNRTITVPSVTSAYSAERDILSNTLPFAHRWPLLMHADDAASAIAMADTFVANSKK